MINTNININSYNAIIIMMMKMNNFKILENKNTSQNYKIINLKQFNKTVHFVHQKCFM